MQREELKLQRVAAEHQARELKNSARFASLTQIETLLERANNRIEKSELGIKKPAEISTFWMQGMSGWKELLETKNPNNYQTKYSDWLKIETIARGYIANVAHALKIYLEYDVGIEFNTIKKDEEFLFIYSSWMNNAPYLSEHAGTAYMTANLVFMFGPALESLQIGFMVSSTKLFGAKVIKMDSLNEKIAKFLNNGGQLPAIADDYHVTD